MQTLVNLLKTVACPVYIYDYICRRFSFMPSTTGNITSVTTSFYTYDADGIITACTDTTTGTINTEHVEFQGKAENQPAFDTPCSVEQDTSITAHITIKPHPCILYYGYRYYSPDLGRWLSRDPIGRFGGFNLYVFVNNSPCSMYDIKGLLSDVEFAVALNLMINSAKFTYSTKATLVKKVVDGPVFRFSVFPLKCWHECTVTCEWAPEDPDGQIHITYSSEFTGNDAVLDAVYKIVLRHEQRHQTIHRDMTSMLNITTKATKHGKRAEVCTQAESEALTEFFVYYRAWLKSYSILQQAWDEADRPISNMEIDLILIEGGRSPYFDPRYADEYHVGGL